MGLDGSTVGRLGFGLMQCRQCGLEMQWPQLEPDELAALYNERYYHAWGFRIGDTSSLRRMKMRSFHRFLSRLPDPHPGDRLLDVGCAMGYLLEAAAERGWEPYGVEISSFSAPIAQRTFGDHVWQGTLEASPFPAAFFGAITMCDVIEHVPDLHAFFGRAAQLLAPGGCLFIVTPNAAGISRRLMGADWPHILPEHLWYFSPQAVARLLPKHNLQVRSLSLGSEYYTLDYLMERVGSYSPRKGLGAALRASRHLLPAWVRHAVFPSASGKLFCLAVRSADD